MPVAIYIFKLSPVGDRWKNNLKFFSVFTATTVLLFLPYLGMIESFFTSSFVSNPSTSGAVANQVTNPVAFGLSYWSLYQLNRLLNFPITAGFVSFVSTASIVLVAVALGLVLK